MASPDDSWSFPIWRWSLACFILAAATGVFMRFGLVHGFPGDLLFGDVRHAHSHLMFFGWGTPVLMLLLLRFAGDTGSRAARLLLGYTLAIALASFLPFLLSGYRLLPLFGRELPVSMMTAGLSGLAWLGFLVLYLQRSRSGKPSAPRAYFGAASLLLLVSAIGVGALAVVGIQGGTQQLINALAIFYVETFAEGWFGIALIGVAYRLLPRVKSGKAATGGLAFLATGLVLRSTADVFAKIGFDSLEPLVHFGSAAAGAGLLLTLAPLWPVLRSLPPSPWHLSLLLLAAKGVFDLLLAVPELSALSDALGLRVFYLHAFLLGAVSIGLIAAARSLWGRAAFSLPWLFSGTVLLMLGALLPISGAWPSAWAGRWAFELAAWTSAGPVLVALIALVTQPRSSPPGMPVRQD